MSASGTIQVQSFSDLLNILFSPKGKYNIVNLANELDKLEVTLFGGEISGKHVPGLVDRVSSLEDELKNLEKTTPNVIDVSSVVSDTIESITRSVTTSSVPVTFGGYALTSPNGLKFSEFLSNLIKGGKNLNDSFLRLSSDFKDFTNGVLDKFSGFVRGFTSLLWSNINSAVKYVTDSRRYNLSDELKVKLADWNIGIFVEGGLTLYQLTENLMYFFRNLPYTFERHISRATRDLNTRLTSLETLVKHISGQLSLDYQHFTSWLKSNAYVLYQEIQENIENLIESKLGNIPSIVDYFSKIKSFLVSHNICTDDIVCFVSDLLKYGESTLSDLVNRLVSDLRNGLTVVSAKLGKLGDINFDLHSIFNGLSIDISRIKNDISSLKNDLSLAIRYMGYLPSIISSSFRKIGNTYVFDNDYTRSINYNGYTYTINSNILGLFTLPGDLNVYKTTHPTEYMSIFLYNVNKAMSDVTSFAMSKLYSALKRSIAMLKDIIRVVADLLGNILFNFNEVEFIERFYSETGLSELNF